MMVERAQPVNVVLLLGGARSGKSELGERVATRLAAGSTVPVTYVATGVVTDEGFAARVAAHRARRPPDWTTVEVGPELTSGLREVHGPALVDSLGTWLAGHAGFEADVDDLVTTLRERRAAGVPTVLVSDEVGLGVHPETEAGRRFRDALGEANRAVAAIADQVVLVVAGRVERLEAVGDEATLDQLLDLGPAG